MAAALPCPSSATSGSLTFRAPISATPPWSFPATQLRVPSARSQFPVRALLPPAWIRPSSLVAGCAPQARPGSFLPPSPAAPSWRLGSPPHLLDARRPAPALALPPSLIPMPELALSHGGCGRHLTHGSRCAPLQAGNSTSKSVARSCFSLGSRTRFSWCRALLHPRVPGPGMELAQFARRARPLQLCFSCVAPAPGAEVPPWLRLVFTCTRLCPLLQLAPLFVLAVGPGLLGRRARAKLPVRVALPLCSPWPVPCSRRGSLLAPCRVLARSYARSARPCRLLRVRLLRPVGGLPLRTASCTLGWLVSAGRTSISYLPWTTHRRPITVARRKTLVLVIDIRSSPTFVLLSFSHPVSMSVPTRCLRIVIARTKESPREDVKRLDGGVREVRVAPSKRSTNCLNRKIITDIVDSSQLLERYDN
ncbi:uncharacterized protein [Zea mays]|uniref:uncharacterized protein n=1 Tax=Zea mays TaxID=4577 RepID=UPI0004DEA2D5|nr:uncharacterized protein LOC103653807 [Zea mays]|eukprot:XP_008678829.1 uncharacterized protein LOC103653807 [Zea mays]